MKKKIVSIMMAAAMVLSLAACGGGSGNESSGGNGTGNEEESAKSSGESYTIGICQLVQHDALDAATEGFKDALTELCGEGNVSFDEQNAQGEHNMCATIVNQFVSDGVDLILANATDPLTTAASATAEIPIIGTSVTDYATALQAENWSGATGINVSGTSDLAPIVEQEAMLKELLPDAKTIGILYCSAEPNSKYQAELFEKALEEAKTIVREYPDVTAIMCGNDQIAVAAKTAVNLSGLDKVIIYGVDGSPDIKKELKKANGQIAGTAAQSPISMGKTMLICME